MSKLKDFFYMLRPRQLLFKNSVIGLALVFSIGKISTDIFFRNIFFIILGFISLGLASGSSYIINDIIDCERDKGHIEKRNRPLASGKISKSRAFLFSMILLLASIILVSILSFYSSFMFLFVVLAMFLLSQIYSLVLRSIIFLDIIAIATNFVLRALSGVFLTKGGSLSYLLVLCTFFLSVFLVGNKRLAEVESLKIEKYRKNYARVNKNFLIVIVAVSGFLVLALFGIYSVLYNPLLLISFPVSIYILFLYFSNAIKKPEKIRNPEEFIFTKKIIRLLLLWAIIVVFSLILY